jgi:serine/threonine protein kinase
VVLCCINGKYCDSRNCKLEIGYASDIGKPLIILWIENLQINDIDQSIGFITSSLKKINCFANPNDWEAKNFDEIKRSALEKINKVNNDRQVTDSSTLIKGRFKKVAKLGEGAQANVYKVEDIQDNETKYKALKVFKSIDDSSIDIKAIKKEMNLLQGVDNPNLIKYLDSFTEQVHNMNFHFLLTTYYEDGTLQDEIAITKAFGKILEAADLMTWSIQILSGIEYLHSKQIIHRDLKPANIYLSKRRLVLGDLGHAKCIIANNSNNSMSNQTFGTDCYIAPEIINILIDGNNGEEYTNKIDLWSFGCILFELITLNKLFVGKTKRTIEDKIFDFRDDQFMDRIDLNSTNGIFVTTLKNSLVKRPEQRNTATSLRNFILGNSSTLRSEDSNRQANASASNSGRQNIPKDNNLACNTGLEVEIDGLRKYLLTRYKYKIKSGIIDMECINKFMGHEKFAAWRNSVTTSTEFKGQVFDLMMKNSKQMDKRSHEKLKNIQKKLICNYKFY